MSDEYDEIPAPRPAATQLRRPDTAVPIPELVAAVYRSARPTLRARMLECLLRPLGPLGLVSIAAGAFGFILHRGGYRQLDVVPEDAARISPEQMMELARYVEQAYPDSLLQMAQLLGDGVHGMAAGFAASLLLLTLQAWRSRVRGE